ncbi:MAG: IS1380 family transposase, partial [Bacteroidota bacterium]
MKIQQSTQLNAFGGINFVYEAFQAMGLGRLFEKALPVLSANSHYTWKDILYSLFSIYFCGGDA